MLHAAPLGFDASTLELWGPLLNGGCVVVHDEQLPTGAGLEPTIQRHGVPTAWLTAALFSAVVDEADRKSVGSGQSVCVRVVRGGRRTITTNNHQGPSTT